MPASKPARSASAKAPRGQAAVKPAPATTKAKAGRQAAKAATPSQAVVPEARPMPPNPPSAPSKSLHAFPNPSPERDYVIQFVVPEFTCHCPLTGQPDFAHFTIDMIPDAYCVELKSLKMYFWSFRDEGAFHEKVTNDILDKIVSVTKPRYIRISARWYVRGGIFTNITVEHRKKGWTPAPAVHLPQHPPVSGLA